MEAPDVEPNQHINRTQPDFEHTNSHPNQRFSNSQGEFQVNMRSLSHGKGWGTTRATKGY